jgi:hypothetical protein
MSGDFSSFGGGDLGGIGGGGFDLSVPDFGGLGDLGNFDLSEVGSSFDLGNLGTSLGDIVDYGDYAQLGDAYNTATSVLDNLQVPDTGSLGGVGQGGFDLSIPDVGGLGGLGNFDISEVGSGINLGDLGNLGTGIGDTIKGGLDTAVDWYKKYGKMAGTIGKLITSYQAGQLSKKQQEELNRKIQEEYDAYNAKKSAFQSQVASGQLPQLNISRGTYSPVRKYNPIFANGGSVRRKYGTGGITDIIASLTIPSMEDILSGYEKYGDPIAQLLKYGLSYGAGQLSKKQQEELNRLRQAQYDKYNEEKSAFTDLITSGNLPKLNIIKGSTPTVKMAMGGITNLKPKTNMGIMGVNR